MTSRKTSLIGFAAASGITLAVHLSFLARKIQPVNDEQYARYGHDLRVTPGWRFGFVAGMHGAFLIKVRNRGGVPQSVDDRRARNLRLVMSRELELIGGKFIGETIFYLLLLCYLFFLGPHLRTSLRKTARSGLARFGANLAPGAIFFILAATPLLIWGYGYGGFTNLVGPGAMSYSGPYFSLGAWLNSSSNSITYRAVVSPIMLPPAMVVQLSWEAFRHVPVYGILMEDVPSITLPYWLAGVLLYGFGGLAIQKLSDAIRKRYARTQA